MFFSSIREVNRSLKEINKLLSKGMSNIYIKVTTEKSDVLKTSIFNFKKFVCRSAFEELQLTQISLTFETSGCKLKIRGLRATL